MNFSMSRRHSMKKNPRIFSGLKNQHFFQFSPTFANWHTYNNCIERTRSQAQRRTYIICSVANCLPTKQCTTHWIFKLCPVILHCTQFFNIIIIVDSGREAYSSNNKARSKLKEIWFDLYFWDSRSKLSKFSIMPSETTVVNKVIVHPLVLLSVVDHFNRMGKIGNQKRVVGVLLGCWRQKGVLDVSNSFAGECRFKNITRPLCECECHQYQHNQWIFAVSLLCLPM